MVTQTQASLVISIIALMTAAGIPIGQQVLSGNEDVLSHYYVCSFFNDDSAGHLKIFKFDRLSTTGQRGYPTVGSSLGYIDCKSGTIRESWKTLVAYAKELGIDPNILLGGEEDIDIPPPTRGDKCWKCGTECVPCNQGGN